jgi:hypothetical protein
MADRYLNHADRCRRVAAMLESKGWTWYKLAQEMGCDSMTVRRNFDLGYKKKHGFCEDHRLSLVRCLARATGTSMGFWLDRKGE